MAKQPKPPKRQGASNNNGAPYNVGAANTTGVATTSSITSERKSADQNGGNAPPIPRELLGQPRGINWQTIMAILTFSSAIVYGVGWVVIDYTQAKANIAQERVDTQDIKSRLDKSADQEAQQGEKINELERRTSILEKQPARK